MSSISKFYGKLVRDHLLLVQSLQCGLLMTVGDILAQFIERTNAAKPKKYDPIRTVRFGGIGVVFVGPVIGTWYKVLSRIVNPKDKYAPYKKVFLDQCVFAPSFLPIFLTVLNTLKGLNWEETKAEVKNKYMDIMIANYKLWPLVQFINFKFLSLQHQLLFNQTVAIFWNTYISWKTN